MRHRFLYLGLALIIGALFIMCKPLPDLNQYVAVPSTEENPTDTAKIAFF
jgi:hypothetical protein